MPSARTERELASDIARVNARLSGTAAELHYLAEELPRLSRPRREFSRAQMAQACRRLLTEAEELCRLKDRIEALVEGTEGDASGVLAL